MICGQATDAIQTFQASYIRKLEAYSQNIADQFNMVLHEITTIIEQPSRKPTDKLVASCWEFISGKTSNFEPRLTLEGDPESFLSEFREATNEMSKGLLGLSFEMVKEVKALRERVNELEDRIEERNSSLMVLQSTHNDTARKFEKQQRDLNSAEVEAIELKKKISDIKRENRAQRCANCKSCIGIKCGKLAKLLCWPLLKSGKCEWPKPITLLCFIPLFVWPLVGCFQCCEYINGEDSKHSCKAIIMCLLPTFTGCVGAAFNRAWLRGELNHECPRDLLLFSFHIWNACLVDIDKACPCGSDD